MRIRLVVLGALAVLAAGCGSTPTANETVPATTTTTAATTSTTVPVSPKPLTLTVFRFEGGLLRPNVVHVPFTPAPATAALAALGVDGTVMVSGGTAHVAAATALTPNQTAEVVFTLTQLATVQRVDVGGRTGLTRDDFPSSLPPILIESPAAGARVPLTFTVSGTATVFEATLVVELVRDGTVIEKQPVTASEGAPGRGTFTTTLHGTPGEATVKAYAPSAADGRPQHEVDVPVTLQAG